MDSQREQDRKNYLPNAPQHPPRNAPQFPVVDGAASKRMFGLKIIIFGLIVFGAVMFMVFTALNVDQRSLGRGRSDTAERLPTMQDSTRLRDELVAVAEAQREARPPENIFTPVKEEQVIEQRPQVIIVQQPRRTERTTRQLTQDEEQMLRRYRDMNRSSISSKSEVDFNPSSARSERVGGAAPVNPMQEMLSQYLALEQANAGSGNAMAAAQQGITEDPNAFQHKLDFLMKDGGNRTPQGYSEHTRRAQLTPMEMKAGTVIPAILLVGINTDLPGTVIGQVSENVYDTATGRYLLIPQGTRILGVYDSRITYGQKRVGIVWNRLIYPDGSSLNIAGSPGVDMAGYSGVRGRVNNHYGALVTAALFTGLFVGAAEIINPQNESSNSSYKSPGQILSETTGTVITQIGARQAERAMNIQPTIVVKPGTRFNVMVQQDVVFTRAWAPIGTRVTGFPQ